MSQIQTIIFYISLICISTFLVKIYIEFDKKVNRNFFTLVLRVIIFLLAITIPVMAAGLRYGIGTDYFYYSRVFANHIQLEYGYYYLNLLAAYTFKDPSTIFFFSSILTMFFLLLGLLYYKNQISVPLSFFIFMSLYYFISYNAVRQIIAVSIVFYAYQYILQKKYIVYVLFIILAAFFHITALIGLSFVFISIQSNFVGRLKRILIILGLIAMIVLFPTIFDFLTAIKLFSHFNLYYIDYNSNKMGILKYAIPNLFLIIIFYKKLANFDKKYKLLSLIFLITIALDILGYYNVWFSRLSYFTAISEIVILPAMAKSIQNTFLRKTMYIYIVIYTVVLFINQYVIMGFQQVIPYTYHI